MPPTAATRHEEVQTQLRPEVLELTGLPPASSVSQIIAALVEARRYSQATELLFGLKFLGLEESLIAQNEEGLNLFRRLYAGRGINLLERLAANHDWQDEKPTQVSGYSLEVYPGEWLIFGVDLQQSLQRIPTLPF